MVTKKDRGKLFSNNPIDGQNNGRHDKTTLDSPFQALRLAILDGDPCYFDGALSDYFDGVISLVVLQNAEQVKRSISLIDELVHQLPGIYESLKYRRQNNPFLRVLQDAYLEYIEYSLMILRG